MIADRASTKLYYICISAHDSTVTYIIISTFFDVTEKLNFFLKVRKKLQMSYPDPTDINPCDRTIKYSNVFLLMHPTLQI